MNTVRQLAGFDRIGTTQLFRIGSILPRSTADFMTADQTPRTDVSHPCAGRRVRAKERTRSRGRALRAGWSCGEAAR